MAYKVEFSPSADRDLTKIDAQQTRRILKYLDKKIATDEDPRRFEAPLRKNLLGLWKYRVGDYRIICEIQDQEVVVLVLRIGHRKKVYGDH